MNYLFSKKSFFYSPGRVLAAALVGMICIGTLLLWMPFAHHGPLRFIDALFTAVSASCVTGLLSVPLASFTFTGQCIILALMQIGGLGLVTLMIFLFSFFFELRLSTRNFMAWLFGQDTWSVSYQLILFILLMTCIIEFIGFIGFFSIIYDKYSFGQAVFYALFHAVSAFTTTGTTFLANSEGQLFAYPGLHALTAIIVLVSSVGFMVWQEILLYIVGFKEKKHFHWSLHSKLIISYMGNILAFTTMMFFYLQYAHNVSLPTLVIEFFSALCNAITCSSSGFTTYNVASTHLATVFLIMIISFVSSTPGSTGTDVKITTLALFIAAIRATIRRHSSVTIKGRTIPNDQIFRAMAIFSLSITWIVATAFCLLITDQGWRFIDIIFETFSAFSNLGLSTGITPYLSTLGKFLIILTMMVGRIGTLTLLLSLRKTEKKELHYPEERVLLG